MGHRNEVRLGRLSEPGSGHDAPVIGGGGFGGGASDGGIHSGGRRVLGLHGRIRVGSYQQTGPMRPRVPPILHRPVVPPPKLLPSLPLQDFLLTNLVNHRSLANCVYLICSLFIIIQLINIYYAFFSSTASHATLLPFHSISMKTYIIVHALLYMLS